MNPLNERAKYIVTAIIETAKDFGRWALSYFIAWFIPNGLAFVMDFSTRAHIVVPGTVVLALTIFFKYIDYAKHKAEKSQDSSQPGVSYGIFGF